MSARPSQWEKALLDCFIPEAAREKSAEATLGLLGNQYLPLPNPAFSTLPQEMVPTASFINNEHPLVLNGTREVFS